MWILPTLNRPSQCKEVIDGLKIHGCSTPGILFVNTTHQDSTESVIQEYKNIDLPEKWEIIICDKNIGLCGAMNHVFKAFPNESSYGLITDDEFVMTDGWDRILIDAAGEWNVSHGDNGWQSDRRIHGFMTIGGELAKAVGYLMPQGLWHWYSDDVWESIASQAGLRKYCQSVKIHNKHWMLKNAEKDRTYELSESRTVQDNEIFYLWKEKEFPIIMDKIFSGMGNPDIVWDVS